MKQASVVATIIWTVLSSCNSNNGWTQANRDKLISSCKEKAVTAMTGNGQQPDAETKNRLDAYCSCYQENLEKQFSSPKDMQNANANDVAKAAQSCLELMAK